MSDAAERHVLRLRPARLEWKAIEGEVIAIDLVDSRYLSLNGSGAILWKMLAAGTDESALADALVERFGLALDEARADVATFLLGLDRRALLERSGSPAA